MKIFFYSIKGCFGVDEPIFSSQSSLYKQIQFNLLKNLRSNTAFKRVNIFVSNEEFENMNKIYKLTNRFKDEKKFINDFNIHKLERFFLGNSKVKINLKSFKIKNTKIRNLIIYDKKKMIKEFESGINKISIKFSIETTVIQNKKQSEFHEDCLRDLVNE